MNSDQLNEALLLAAVYGDYAQPGAELSVWRTLFPVPGADKNSNSGGCGSSSCGGGGCAEAAVAVAADRDRVGIGWRQPLAAGIFTHLDAIDVIEVIVGLGPASVSAVDEDRLRDIARVVATLEPCAWSEHLSFVRSGGHEIGHLAAPPRSEATVEGAARNLRRLRQVVGMGPAVENIATLMEPPASPMHEPEWVAAVTSTADTPLLLDLHNLYANARSRRAAALPTPR